MSRDDMFSRWADRRARVAREEAEAEKPAPAKEAPAIPEPETEAEEDALLAQLGLPRPEDVAGEEIRKFLASGVPEFLRRRALRALWRSDPTFAVLDGLNDYDEDFNLPEFNQKVVATAYQVGRGIVREIEAKIAEAEPEADAPEEAVTTPETSVRPPEQDVMPVEDPPKETELAQDDPQEPVFAPRRMVFDT